MDLSKAFDKINHSSLVAKLEAYGFSKINEKLMQGCLCNRFGEANVNGSFSDYSKILAGFPQGSILGLLLFNVFLKYILLFITYSNLSSYADDNTRNAINRNLLVVKSNLEANLAIMLKWFYENHVVRNPGKRHYIFIDNRDEPDE